MSDEEGSMEKIGGALPAPTSKLDGRGGAPASAAGFVSDPVAWGGLLVEGLAPGAFNAERAVAVTKAIRERAERLRQGNTAGLEDALAAQLVWLESLIAYAVRKATAAGVGASAADVWLRLAMRAQGAYVKTVAAFAVTRERVIQ